MAWRPEWENEGRGGGGGAFRRPFFGGGGWNVTRTIVIVCVVGQFLSLISSKMDSQPVLTWLALRAGNAFLLYPFVSYVFFHAADSLFHLAMNLLILWFVGTDLETHLGRRRYLGLFFGAAVFGGLLFLITEAVRFGSGTAVIGASGGILGLIAYVAWAFPDRTFIFFIVPVRARTLFWVLVALDLYHALVSFLGFHGSVANFCHLGGALFGYLFWRYRLDPFASMASLRVEWRARKQVRRQDQEERDREEMDRLLQKIHEEGMPSLTPAERRFLDERSRRTRKGR